MQRSLNGNDCRRKCAGLEVFISLLGLYPVSVCLSVSLSVCLSVSLSLSHSLIFLKSILYNVLRKCVNILFGSHSISGSRKRNFLSNVVQLRKWRKISHAQLGLIITVTPLQSNLELDRPQIYKCTFFFFLLCEILQFL